MPKCTDKCYVICDFAFSLCAFACVCVCSGPIKNDILKQRRPIYSLWFCRQSRIHLKRMTSHAKWLFFLGCFCCLGCLHFHSNAVFVGQTLLMTCMILIGRSKRMFSFVFAFALVFYGICDYQRWKISQLKIIFHFWKTDFSGSSSKRIFFLGKFWRYKVIYLHKKSFFFPFTANIFAINVFSSLAKETRYKVKSKLRLFECVQTDDLANWSKWNTEMIFFNSPTDPMNWNNNMFFAHVSFSMSHLALLVESYMILKMGWRSERNSFEIRFVIWQNERKYWREFEMSFVLHTIL